MSSDDLSELCLKTVSGRTCLLSPPFTVGRVLDAAARELRLHRASVKLFAKGRQINTDDSADARGAEVKVPETGVIFVVGKPQRSLERRADAEQTASTASKVFVTDLSEKEDAHAKRTVGAGGDKTSSSCLRIYTGFLRKDLYFYLKSFVFMHGWDGLQDMVKQGDPNIFHHFRGHPTVVSIVEYVDRVPARLKEVLISIKEDEPWFFRWIENNAEYFLDVINTPTSWGDETSPRWLIRQAKEIYSNEITIQREVTAAVPESKGKMWRFGGAAHSPLLPREGRSKVEISEKKPKPTVQKLQRTDMGTASGSKSLVTGVIHPTETVHKQIVCGVLSDPLYAQVIEEDKMRSAAIEKWNRASSVAQQREYANDIAAQLRRTNAAYLDVIGSSIRADGEFVTLPKKLIEMAHKSWSESEHWFIQQNDAKGALECALGLMLFNFGEEFISSRRGTKPLLDSEVRWITSEGSRLLAQELQNYSSSEAFTIVIYSKSSSDCAYAYILKGGGVNFSPILMDETADCENRDLERFYTVVAQKPTMKKAAAFKKSLWAPWKSLMTELYKRFITPIEAMLPPPAHTTGDDPATIGQVCFIHTWASEKFSIPFAALRHPESGESCVLRWALFMSSRPWHLILSKLIPWSSAVLNSPVVTRFADPVRVCPWERVESQESEESQGFPSNVTTYLQTKGAGHTLLHKNAKADESSAMWKDVPWASWIKHAMEGTRSALPPLGFLQGREEPPHKTTALLIHEVARDANSAAHATMSTERTDSLAQRSAPYNQSADLFVSFASGRESGVGVHRAALISMYRVAGKIPTDMNQMFFSGLVATGDMTAAKAYRLALLTSWKGECKDDPWRSACVGLFNYGGPMRTLNTLHGIYHRRPQLQSKRISVERERNSGAMLSNPRSAYRSTPEGQYIEGHAIDVIFEVLLQEVTSKQPVGEVAILDCFIESMKANKTKLQNYVDARQRERRSKKIPLAVSASRQPSTTSLSGSLPALESNRVVGYASKIVSEKRNMTNGENCGVSRKSSNNEN